LSYFPLIGNGLAWKIGNGHLVHIGVDPCPGSDVSHVLPQNIITSLQEQGIFILNQVVDPLFTTIWSLGWKSTISLGLEGVEGRLWEMYTGSLQSSHIHLVTRKDELIWDHAPTGV